MSADTVMRDGRPMRGGKPIETVPRPALIAAGLLICFSLGMVGFARYTGYKWEWSQGGTVVKTRAVQFAHVGDGDIQIEDATSGKVLGRYTFTENAFMRTVMMGLLKERQMVAADRREPFNIQQWNDGRVTVSDPVSGRYFEMAAFGHHQVATFSILLY